MENMEVKAKRSAEVPATEKGQAGRRKKRKKRGRTAQETALFACLLVQAERLGTQDGGDGEEDAQPRPARKPTRTVGESLPPRGIRRGKADASVDFFAERRGRTESTLPLQSKPSKPCRQGLWER
jgi:hypothetical protein